MHSVLVLLGILAVQAIVWVPIVVWSRRRAARAAEAIIEWALNSRERLVIEPERVIYCLAGTVGAMRVEALAALTERRVAIEPFVGSRTGIPLADIAGISDSKWFRGSYRSGRTHVVLKLQDGREVALLVRDAERWLAALAPAGALRQRA